MINCIAIDDEPLALKVLVKHIEKIPFLNLVATFQNPIEAITKIEEGDIDLIFLDIQMPEMTGLEFSESLKKKPLIVFTTAYPNFAAESYNHDAIDYLLKPIPFARLLKAANKAKEVLKTREASKPKTTENVDDKNYIFVKSEYKTVKINLKDILFIESLKDYVIFNFEDKKISSLLSLGSVEEQLPKNKFYRVHRSFIVALDKIDAIERNLIHISSRTINVSDSYREQFHRLIEERKIK